MLSYGACTFTGKQHNIELYLYMVCNTQKGTSGHLREISSRIIQDNTLILH